MSVLLDSNILLRWAQPWHPSHGVAAQSVARLLSQGAKVYYTPQNIIEFWNVATRPAANNGLGLSRDLVLAELIHMERMLTLIPDSPAIFPAWKTLVVQYGVVGVQVHDARLATVALVNHIPRILTFNTGDFSRYRHLSVLHPSNVQ